MPLLFLAIFSSSETWASVSECIPSPASLFSLFCLPLQLPFLLAGFLSFQPSGFFLTMSLLLPPLSRGSHIGWPSWGPVAAGLWVERRGGLWFDGWSLFNSGFFCLHLRAALFFRESSLATFFISFSQFYLSGNTDFSLVRADAWGWGQAWEETALAEFRAGRKLVWVCQAKEKRTWMGGSWSSSFGIKWD